MCAWNDAFVKAYTGRSRFTSDVVCSSELLLVAAAAAATAAALSAAILTVGCDVSRSDNAATR